MAWHLLLFICFSVSGIGLGILFFLKKKGNSFANSILAIYTILFSFELFYNCLKWSNLLYEANFVHFSFTNFPIWMVYGPLLFIYVRKITTGKGFQITDILFVTPIAAVLVLLSPFYFLNADKKLTVLQNGTFYDVVWLSPYSIWYIMLLMASYAVLIYYKFGPRQNTGYRENKWLFWFIGSYLGFVLAFFGYVFSVWFELMDPSYDYFVDIVIVGFIAILAFFGFVQPEVFEGKSIKEVIGFVKYKKTGLSDRLSEEMKEKLLDIMQTDKPYLDNTLRLNHLAKKLNLSRNHTSQIINQHFNFNFFDFINKYRIEDAKHLLINTFGKSANITQIAYDVGFNNRASFYKAFQKFEGINPTQYLEKASVGSL